jgi:succinate-semialdehyde dehydrogenase/glutarate-semialdehyde dehydrogenase
MAEREEVIRRFHDLVIDRQEEGLDLVQMESGKSRADALVELLDVPFVARYYGYHGADALARESRRGAIPLLTRVEVNHVPVGVVGIIAPWNYPLSMGITDALPALLAGNAVVIKPAEQTPLTALWAADLLYAAGLPRDLLHVLPGEGSVIGSALVGGADFVHFTGSTEVGRLVAAQAAERLVGCSLELGGKNPMLVLDDADLDRTVTGAVQACFASAGQLCISVERLYVQQPLYAAFAERFVAAVGALRIGASYAYGTDMGSLAGPEQLEKVTAHVADAVAKGATVLAGGHPLPELGPFFYAPTVVADVTPDMDLFDEETFGPVVALAPFRTDDDGVRLANASDYGLNASVWTTDAARGRRVARQIRAGSVNLNEAFIASWGSTDAPMGGMGQSGLGRRHGPEGIVKYTEAQTVAEQRLISLSEVPGLVTEGAADLALRGLRLLRRLPGLR